MKRDPRPGAPGGVPSGDVAHADPPPICARCGSDCELTRENGDLRQWDCLQCWAFVIIPRTHPAWTNAATTEAARAAWANATVTPILAVPAASPEDIEDSRASRSIAGRHRGDPG
jgi:hypothetical protein